MPEGRSRRSAYLFDDGRRRSSPDAGDGADDDAGARARPARVKTRTRTARRSRRRWHKVSACPTNTVVVTCDARAGNCPGRTGRRRATLLLPLQARPRPRDHAGPADDRRDAEASGTRADIDPTTGQPIVLMQFTGKGNKAFQRHHARRGAARHAARRLGRHRSTSRSCSTTRSGRSPQIDYTQYPNGIDPTATAPRSPASSGHSEAKDLALVLQTGALPVQVQTRSSAPTSRRRSARTRCTGRRRAAIVGLLARRDLPAHPLPLPRPRRRDRPRHLRGVPVRGDPALQRDADAAGLRRADPDDRRRGGRERRHLRTHQGRGARGQVRARRDRAPATPRASTRSSTRTS